MDLDAYWQENKRFVVGVGAGALLFLVGFMVESSVYGDDLAAARREIQGYRNDLARAPYDDADRRDAQNDNDALRAASERLAEAGRFHPRPEFVHDPASGSVANHYLRTLSEVRETLTQRANRAGMEIDPSLGMPELSPTVETETIRYLEALDLVDSVCDLALRARVARIDRIQTRLDPGHGSRQGVGAIERTRVTLTMTGSSLALARVLAWTQRPPQGGRVLPIDGVEIVRSRSKRGEERMDVTFAVVRVRPREEAE
jgi:hypothetical protein